MHKLFVTSARCLKLGEQAKFTQSTAPKIQTFQKDLKVDSRLACIPVVIGVCAYVLVSDLNSANIILWLYNGGFMWLVFWISVAN